MQITAQTNKKFTNSTLCIESITLDDFITHIKQPSEYKSALHKLLTLYDIERSFPDMSHFRLGPNMFDKIFLNFIVFIRNDTENNTSQLIGHAVTTSISWDQNPKTLPNGWQGAVRKSYENASNSTTQNTLVGLYIRIENEYREQGWSEFAIKAMKTFAKDKGFESLIIPLRLPQRFNYQFAKIAYKKFIQLKRKDGQYQDHWLRLHTRLGGKIISTCNFSHQHAMNLTDFFQQFNCKKIKRSGYYLAEKNGLWYNVYIDTKRQFSLINQECTWVQHPIA